MGIDMELLLKFSIGLNIFLVFAFFASFFIRMKPKQLPPKHSLELQEFLADLMVGDGLIRVERISPANVFMHNPKGVDR